MLWGSRWLQNWPTQDCVSPVLYHWFTDHFTVIHISILQAFTEHWQCARCCGDRSLAVLTEMNRWQRGEPGPEVQQAEPHEWPLLAARALTGVLGIQSGSSQSLCVCKQCPCRAVACFPSQLSWFAAFIGHLIAAIIALLGNVFLSNLSLYFIFVIS